MVFGYSDRLKGDRYSPALSEADQRAGAGQACSIGYQVIVAGMTQIVNHEFSLL